MNNTSYDPFREIELKRKNYKKLPKGRWYNGNSLLGNDWAIFYFILGAGATGKSYWAMKHVVSAKLANPKNVKLFWTRLTERQCEKLLTDNAAHLLDPDLYRKFGYDLRRRGSTVNYGTVKTTIGRTGKETSQFQKIGELCQVQPLSTFFNNKGEALFDNEFDGTYYIVLDEMNRELGEANRFDIVDAFANQLENFTRSSKSRVVVLCIGNNTDDVSDILAAFNFIPRDFGRFKLKRRKAIVEVIKPSAEYYADREKSAGYLLAPDAGRFKEKTSDEGFDLLANEHDLRTAKPTMVLKFQKAAFTVWDGKIIRQNKNELAPTYGMRKHIGEKFILEFVNKIEELYNTRSFLFDNYTTYILFTKQMSLNKKGT